MHPRKVKKLRESDRSCTLNNKSKALIWQSRRRIILGREASEKQFVAITVISQSSADKAGMVPEMALGSGMIHGPLKP